MSLEVASSVLTFVGSGILVIDAFLAPKRAEAKAGAEFADAAKKPAEEPSAASQYEERVARSTRWLSIVGFAIMATGFLLDLAVKCHWTHG